MPSLTLASALISPCWGGCVGHYWHDCEGWTPWGSIRWLLFGVAVWPCYDMRCVVCFSLSGNCVVLQNLLSYHRALYRTLHHQLGGGRNLKSVVLYWLCTSGVVYACYAIIFCTCLCISKRMGCCLCMRLSLLLCGRLAPRF